MEEFAQLCREARLAIERDRVEKGRADKTIHDLVGRFQFPIRDDFVYIDMRRRYFVPAPAPGGDVHGHLEQFVLSYRTDLDEDSMREFDFPAGEPQHVWLFRNGREVCRPPPVVYPNPEPQNRGSKPKH